MPQPLRILLQTTLPAGTENDWTIDRFALLQGYLTNLTDSEGNPLCVVTARDRHPDVHGNDPVLSHLSRDQFDQLWLFALDVGDGLSAADFAGIIAFHQQGGGIFTTRDHQDMGLSMCGMGEIGQYHYFHSQHPDPDPDRCCADDIYTTYISWPNYHSGRNGDYQTITPVEPIHALLRYPDSPTEVINRFPAHPHEGGVGVPDGVSHARVIAIGTSQITTRPFNLVVAAERVTDAAGHQLGKVVAQSTFHHFVDYNWDVACGCPTFVDEPPGDGMATDPRALADIQTYVSNLVRWLSD